MESLAQARVAGGLTALLGVWLMLSPIWISISDGALISLLITGGVMIVAGFGQLYWQNTLPSWIAGLAAVWLFIAAFAFNVSSGAAWNEAVSAIIAFMLATWDGVEMTEFRHHRGAV